MAWAKNGTPQTLSGVADVVQITDLTAYKFNQFLIHEIANGVTDNQDITFNNNTNTVYARRQSTNGGSDGTTNSDSGVNIGLGNAAWDQFTLAYFISISGEEKLGIDFVMGGNSAGAGSAPDRMEQVFKFVPSPDADVTRIDDTNTGAGGDYDTGSNISAIGTD